MSKALMDLMKWNAIKYRLKKLLSIPRQKKYLSILVDDLEKQKAQNNSLAFKITKINEKGFTVRVSGLYAYISFNHMPWQYYNRKAWKAVFPTLTGKVFFCKIFSIDSDPLFIMIDGKIPQFKTPELIEDKSYSGIIIRKTYYGAFIDIGYHFKWKCGSLIGMLRKSNFDSIDLFEKLETGQIIETIFWGFNEKNNLILGKNAQLKEWFNGKLDNLIGEVIDVKVIVTDDTIIDYLVLDKYKAILPVTKAAYPENKTQLKRAIRYLENDEIIHCEVVDIDKSARTLHLKWEIQWEIETISSRHKLKQAKSKRQRKHIAENTVSTIEDSLNEEIVQKLKLIGKTVKVEVIVKSLQFGRFQTKYLVENKYEGKLKISNGDYRMTKKEMKQLEKNLNNGDVLVCKILGIENNMFNLKWDVKNEEISSVQNK